MSRDTVETAPYIAFAKRILRAAGKRVGDGDDFDLGELIALRTDLEDAIAAAVAGIRAQGQSWAYIGSGLGISRQSAHERYGSISNEGNGTSLDHKSTGLERER
ncbi:hypothetical protein [Arthrobacter russicus]|uniref:Helix-turn-helix domain-containing protein n=1 Tax=Arthrobacter russicus TaxID=172040 RepID=A0ABU1JDW4_9MICC|nr:hypothetical protein [Arthrobacter russicus]MDR6270627.1 hypothetical protein [Arthrobacter russicus]